MRHTYYRIAFRAASAISVGSGANVRTDHDVIRHPNGAPYIPASTIAGVLRHHLDGNEPLQTALFGTIIGETVPSALICYDAELTSGYADTVRDSVRLENKVGVDRGKFDMEAIESGAAFVTYLELEKMHEQFTEDVEKLLLAVKNGILRFGHKTTRGYGEVEITDARKMQFDLDDPAQLDAWLAFEMTDDASWQTAAPLALAEMSDDCLSIRMRLTQQSGLSIRTYLTDPKTPDTPLPDFKQMTMQDGTPVIPGTSWAGAFRDRFTQLTSPEMGNDVFGLVDEQSKTTQRSRILFSESRIEGAVFKDMTRSSIDRFSGATKDGALYTERTCYGGTTTLTITIPGGLEEPARLALSAVLLDLHHGYLSLGGLTSVGRGLFRIEQLSVNGQDRTALLDPAHLRALLEV